jgi:large subunit ribosomal protein L18Ae
VFVSALMQFAPNRYQDVAARHRSRFSNVQIVRTGQVPVDAIRKTVNSDYLGNKVAFPLTHRVLRPATKSFKKTFVARRPRTCFDH